MDEISEIIEIIIKQKRSCFGYCGGCERCALYKDVQYKNGFTCKLLKKFYYSLSDSRTLNSVRLQSAKLYKLKYIVEKIK